jgi:hypothetical protein
MSLEKWGLQGAPARGSFYEQSPGALEQALERQAFMEKALKDSPSLGMFLSSDPDNRGQATAKSELVALLGNAFEISRGFR